MSALIDQCQGKWKSIHRAIGIDEKFLNPRKNGPCPICGGSDRWRWTDFEGRGGWVCNNCGRGAGADLVKLFLKCDFPTAAERIKAVLGIATEEKRDDRDDNAKREAMRKLWVSAKPLTHGGVADKYLRSRGIALSSFPSCLRELPGVMLAQIIGTDGKAVNIQKTIFDSAGRKIERKMMPGACPHGSAIRIAPSAKIMGVAEGLETALSAMFLYRVPVWSAISDGGLSKFDPPESVEELLVFCDNDNSFAGQAASYSLAKAMIRKIKVSVLVPDTVGHDWNDVLLSNLGMVKT